MPSGPLDVERDFEAAADGKAIAKAIAKADADVAMDEGWQERAGSGGLHVRGEPKNMQHICHAVVSRYSRTSLDCIVLIKKNILFKFSLYPTYQ